MGILENWKKQYDEDKVQQNYDIPKNLNGEEVFVNESFANDHEVEQYYKEELDRQRNDPNDMENVFNNKINSMENVSDIELAEKAFFEDVKISVMHAYCPKCGKEIISKTPVMYNPFTNQKICAYKCPDCGTEYNFEYAYPRIVLLNGEGDEVFAHND